MRTRSEFPAWYCLLTGQVQSSQKSSNFDLHLMSSCLYLPECVKLGNGATLFLPTVLFQETGIEIKNLPI